MAPFFGVGHEHQICVRLTAQQVAQIVRDSHGSGATNFVALLAGHIARHEIPPIHVWEQRGREAGGTSQVSSSLVKGLLVLAALSDGEPTSVTDLATALEMKPSTTHRYMNTLLTLGLLQQDPKTRLYRLAI